MMNSETKICVVGLGYVGLPLAVEFAKHFDTVGFDVNSKKVQELKEGVDKTGEVESETLNNSKLRYSSDPKVISEANFVIVAVPTPIDESFKPDLGAVESASKLVGQNLAKGSTVVFESTVYPGVTEDVCLPIIEENSGLKCGPDFKIGYSPERVNPGDKEHTVDKIVKVVSGMDAEPLDLVSNVYGKAITAGLFKAKDIKTAEAAKVIENIQRDLNIALMNELSLIFSKMGVNTLDVIEAAGTKWNFHKYHPGLVGGHCIGVDPYYLTYAAEQVGHNPKVILAGRSTNEYMAAHVAQMVVDSLEKVGKDPKNSVIYIMGLTFKDNVPDPRNSKAKDVIKYLKDKGVTVCGFDPLLDNDTVIKLFGIENVALGKVERFDGAILINGHDPFKEYSLEMLKNKMDKPIIVDVKSFFNRQEAEELGFVYKCL